MSYLTKAQIIDRFGAEKIAQLTDRFGDGDIDNDALNEAIADASRIIDSYVGPRYSLPLGQARIDASPLTRFAGDLVVYFLQGDLASEESERRYKEALAFLRDVQRGQASLGADDTVAVPAGEVQTRTGESSNYDWSAY